MNSSTQEMDGPVFIVGMNGSGTTMLLDHLGHHPDLYGFSVETYLLPWYLSTERKYGDLTIDSNFLELWNNMRTAYPFRIANKGMAIDLPPDWRDAPRHVGGIFDRIMREFARREGKERWCEKTPMHVLHMTDIAESFPAGRFIHIIRDGRDCAVSCHRRWGRHPNATIIRWKRVIDEGRRQGKLLPGRYLELRYEEVTGDPELHMRASCEFLGIAFDERVLLTSRRRKHMPGQDSETIVPNRHGNETYFTDSRMLSLERIAGQRLLSLGYRTRCPNSNLEPSILARGWWAVHDIWRVLIRQLRNRLIRKRTTWPLLFARWKTILRSKSR